MATERNDDPWDFGTSDQYPALKVDFNGDNIATWQEFSYQLRERPRLTATVSGAQTSLTWSAVDTSHWTPAPSVSYELYRDGEKMAGYDGSAPSYTDKGLSAGQTYTYQVAALPNGMEIRRSKRVTATAEAELPAQTCANGIILANPEENPGLVQDCVALLTAKDVLAGTATLNWSADEPITQWDGVGVSDGRVQSLELRDKGLNGSIPAGLGQLSGLKRLWLSDNPMSGSIPAELGQLSELTLLRLDRNGLSGSIPAEFGQLSELGALSLHSNKLSGSIPPQLGQLENLTVLTLHINRLSGSIPAELGQLSKLSMIRLSGNDFSGCVPAEFESMTNTDLARLELPYCEVPEE